MKKYLTIYQLSLVCLAVCLLASCVGKSGNPSQVDEVIHTPPAGVEQIAGQPTDGFAITFPSGDANNAAPPREVSEGTFNVLGKDSVQTSSGNTEIEGNALKLLPSGANDVAYGIWAVTGLTEGRPVTLSAEISEAEPGRGVHYYVGVASYSANRWDWHGPFTQTKILTINSYVNQNRYVSATGTLYCSVVAVGAVDNSAVQVNSIETETQYDALPNAPHYTRIGEVVQEGYTFRINWTHIDDFGVWDRIHEATTQTVYRDGPLDAYPYPIGTVDSGNELYLDPISNTQGIYEWTAGYVYEYSISSTNAAGQSSIRMPVATITVPIEPASAVATIDSETSKVKLEWNGKSGAKGYHIWRSPTADVGDANEIAQVGAGAREYIDLTTTASDYKYWYWVRSVGEGLTLVESDDILSDFGESANLVFASLWQHSFRYPTGTSGQGASSVNLDPAGNVLVTSNLTDGYTSFIALTKLTDSGELTWTKNWKGVTSHQYNTSQDSTVDISGNLYALSHSRDWDPGSTYLLKFSTSGTHLLEESWLADSQNSGQAVETDGSGNAYVAGYTDSSLGDNARGILLKYNPSGVLQWSQEWNMPDIDFFVDLQVDDLGNSYLLARQGSGGDGTALVKYSPAGELLWERGWAPFDIADGCTLLLHPNGYLYVINSEMFARIDTDGNLDMVVNLLADSWPYAVCADDAGNIYCAGSMGSGSIFLRKYGADGTVLSNRKMVSPNSFGVSGLAHRNNVLYICGWMESLDGTLGNWEDVGYGLGETVITLVPVSGTELPSSVTAGVEEGELFEHDYTWDAGGAFVAAFNTDGM